MKKKQKSLSQKFFSNFIFSFLIPIILINIIVSYLYTTSEIREFNYQASNNLKLLSADTVNYFNVLNNVTKAPLYDPFFQSKSPVSALSPYEQNQLGKKLGDILQLTTYSRDDLDDIIILSDNQILYFNSTDWYRYLPTISPLTDRNWYTNAVNKNGKLAISPFDTADHPEGSFNTDYFFVSRKINNLYLPSQTNIIMLKLSTSPFQSLYKSLVSDIPMIILFTGEDNSLIYSSKEINLNNINSLESPILHINNGTWNNFYQKLDSYPLTVHILLSTSYIQKRVTAFIFLSFIFYLLGTIAHI